MATSARPRRIIILGATGSIGTSTLQVVEHLNRIAPGSFEVVGLSAGRNAEALIRLAERHGVKHVVLASASPSMASAHGLMLFTGSDAAERLVERVEADVVVAAIVGSAGLSAVAAAIRKGCDIALANKETLVAAGEIIMPLAARHGSHILPVDSEHSAIFQCLQSRESNSQERGVNASSVRRIVLTASGGPFRTWTRQRIASATVAEALNHPTWSMGAKITIDSASMTNKALEIIEAHHLFGLPSERIEVIVHPQSIVHSFVEFNDGSVLAQLGRPDMRTPIQYALTWPQRPEGCAPCVDWGALTRLDFEPPDEDRFPALRLARLVVERGGTSGAIFNAANEVAVAAFLEGRIPFGRISELAAEALVSIESRPIGSLEDVFETDRRTRRHVQADLYPAPATPRAAGSR